MQIDFRNLHHDDTWNTRGLFHIGLQKGQNIDAADAFSLLLYGSGGLMFGTVNHRMNLQQRIHIIIHIVKYVTHSAVFAKACVDLFHKTIQVQVVQFIFE